MRDSLNTLASNRTFGATSSLLLVLVSLELGLEVVQEVHGALKHHRVMGMWDMEMQLRGVVLVVLVQQ